MVTWIDGSVIMLPLGASSSLLGAFPPLGIVGGPLNIVQYPVCLAELAFLTNGNPGFASNTPADTAYANAWLLKYSSNQNPGSRITPSKFTSFNFQYRLFADYAPGQGIQTTSIGYTPDPCGTPFVYVQGVPYSDPIGGKNGDTGPSQAGYQYLLAETRVGTAGQKGWMTLNNHQEIPWVWSVIEFDQNGSYVMDQNTANYQIFPTYSVYKNGVFMYRGRTTQSTVSAFANLPPGQSLMEKDIR
ncbi:MAG: hypothetical protein ABI147_06695 [Acidobacteriaceae bacterium]